MGNKKAVFPKVLLNDDIEENNKRWLNEYENKTDFGKGYYQALENFLRFNEYEKKAFNTFSTSDVEEYILIMIENGFSTSRISYIISNINSFKSYLIANYPQMFSDLLLNDLLELKMDLEKKYIDKESLNLVQLNCIKEFIKENIHCEYFFEIFYQLNIQKKDINCCCPEYANKKKMMFEKDGIEIPYNEKIQELLLKTEKISQYKSNYATVNFYLNKIEAHLKLNGIYNMKKKFSYGDIKKTHEAFFLKCPNCGNEYENISSNWALAKIGSNIDDYYLVCSICKGEPPNECFEN